MHHQQWGVLHSYLLSDYPCCEVAYTWTCSVNFSQCASKAVPLGSTSAALIDVSDSSFASSRACSCGGVQTGSWAFVVDSVPFQ